MYEYSTTDVSRKFHQSVSIVEGEAHLCGKSVPRDFYYCTNSAEYNGGMRLTNAEGKRFEVRDSSSLKFTYFRFAAGYYPSTFVVGTKRGYFKLQKRCEQRIYNMGLNAHTFQFKGDCDSSWSCLKGIIGTFENPVYNTNLKNPGALSLLYIMDSDYLIYSIFGNIVASVDHVTKKIKIHREEQEFNDLLKRNEYYGGYKIVN